MMARARAKATKGGGGGEGGSQHAVRCVQVKQVQSCLCTRVPVPRTRDVAEKRVDSLAGLVGLAGLAGLAGQSLEARARADDLR